MLKRFKKVVALTLAAALVFGMANMSAPAMEAKADTLVTGTFKALSINVAGLPAIISSGSPATDTVQLSPRLNDYDIVSTQEDFAYHSDLVSALTLPHQTVFSGNVPFGDGMDIFSNFVIYQETRTKWNDAYGFINNGADEMTPKGILYTSLEIQPGVFIDVYDIHTDADCDEGSLAARRSNMNQLAEMIRQRSEGKAVIVIGDTNSRYTREGDNFESAVLDTCGLTDAWIELVRGGVRPADGDALTDASDKNGPNYEVVDKIWYRSGVNLDLQATFYKLLDTEFLDDNGKLLSDHYPITATFEYTVIPTVISSDTFGGGGGTGFSFVTAMGTSMPDSVTIRTGSRVDGLSATYGTRTANAGGNGGNVQTLTFAPGEYIQSVTVSKAKKSLFGTYRISYIKITTNFGRSIEGGSYKSNASMTYNAPEGYCIGGFYGMCADEIDRIGMLYLYKD